MSNTIESKVCKACGLPLPLTEFSVIKKNKQGVEYRRNECNECRRGKARQYRKEYYDANRDEVKQKRNETYQATKKKKQLVVQKLLQCVLCMVL